MATPKFSFNDYDCIGFDFDSTLARYKQGNLITLIYAEICDILIKKGYPSDCLLKPIDTNFLIKGLIADNENGNLVRITADGTILQATHGTKRLSQEEIFKYYPTGHSISIDAFVADPLSMSYEYYSGKIKIFSDCYAVATSLAFARAVDTVEALKTTKRICDIWPDILAANIRIYKGENFLNNVGEFPVQVKNYPNRYFYKCSANVLNLLRDLKKNGKKLFLLTGSDVEYINYAARQVLFDNWRDYFDIVICSADKPGFFIKDADFISVDELSEAGKLATKDLKEGGIYKQGNWIGLKEFLSESIESTQPKFLYVGDNLMEDIYAPHVYCDCDTVSVCNEVEVENAFGFIGEPNPDHEFMRSALWGSFFNFNNGVETYWFNIIKKHAKISVPSIEYLAKFPVDHEFDLISTLVAKDNGDTKSVEN